MYLPPMHPRQRNQPTNEETTTRRECQRFDRTPLEPLVQRDRSRPPCIERAQSHLLPWPPPARVLAKCSLVFKYKQKATATPIHAHINRSPHRIANHTGLTIAPPVADGVSTSRPSQITIASVAARRSLSLVLVVVAVWVTGAAGSKSFNITNNCSYTVWPGILSGAGSAAALDSTGFELAPGESRAMPVPSGWSGRLWGRTLCSTDTGTGAKFICVTGDCGSGKQDCDGGGPAPPVTLAEFTMDGSGGMDFYDVNLADGFNLPMIVAPQGACTAAGGNCAPTGCVVDLNGACPAELRAMSSAASTGAVACKSACQTFRSAEYCCTGAYGNPGTCKPSAYSEFFKQACPRAYSYAYDGATSTFTRAGADTCTYAITFCPSTTSTKPSTSPNSPTPVTGNIDGSTTPYTGGGSQVGAAATAPWRIVLIVAVMGAVTAALGLLAKSLDLFKLCCHQPAAGAAAG